MNRPSRWPTVVGVLLLLAPVMLPVVILLLLLVAFLVLMVLQAFDAGFAAGCAALSALIGIPSVVALWLSGVARLLGIGRRRLCRRRLDRR